MFFTKQPACIVTESESESTHWIILLRKKTRLHKAHDFGQIQYTCSNKIRDEMPQQLVRDVRYDVLKLKIKFCWITSNFFEMG
jgi:hypothetical protein